MSSSSLTIVKVHAIVRMEEANSFLLVGTLSSGQIARGATASLGADALATVLGMREVAAGEGAFVGVLLRCRSEEDTRRWLDSNLEGKDLVFQSTRVSA